MAADAPTAQRRLLLPMLVMAGTAALAGALAASLLSRNAPLGGIASPSLTLPTAAPVACARPGVPVRTADPMAALDAALGRPVAFRTSLDDAPLASLLAAPEAAATVTVAAVVGPPPPVVAPAPATPPLATGYGLELGYFLVPEQAAAFATRVQERGVPVQLLPLPDPSGRVWTHVRTAPFAGSAQALAGAARIERDLGIPARLIAPAVTTPDQSVPAGAPRP